MTVSHPVLSPWPHSQFFPPFSLLETNRLQLEKRGPPLGCFLQTVPSGSSRTHPMARYKKKTPALNDAGVMPACRRIKQTGALADQPSRCQCWVMMRVSCGQVRAVFPAVTTCSVPSCHHPQSRRREHLFGQAEPEPEPVSRNSCLPHLAFSDAAGPGTGTYLGTIWQRDITSAWGWPSNAHYGVESRTSTSHRNLPCVCGDWTRTPQRIPTPFSLSLMGGLVRDCAGSRALQVLWAGWAASVADQILARVDAANRDHITNGRLDPLIAIT